MSKWTFLYLFFYTINNMIPYLVFNILHTKIPSHKFLNFLNTPIF